MAWQDEGTWVMVAAVASCEHCGTEYARQKGAVERYCCRGCEYVAAMIAENGFEQYYDLKLGLAVTPVRSRPFEEHDFSWLDGKMAEAERRALQQGEAAHMELSLEGISCVGCVWLVEKLFVRHAGAVRAAANPSSGRLYLEWVPTHCELVGYLRELCQFGYVAAPAGAVSGDHERMRLAARIGLCGAFALNTMAFTLPVYLDMPADFEFAAVFRLIALTSATLSMLAGGGYFMERAWRSLRAGSLHIDMPIALGLLAAYAASIGGWIMKYERLVYFDFVSVFVFLMLSGRYLQTSAVEKNRRRLVRRQPVPDALPLLDQGGAMVGREALAPGLRFLLGPGQALPVSGVMVTGEADFSLEWIHGEAVPQRFVAGSRLPAGAILLSRVPAAVEASERWEDSLLAKLTAPLAGERGSPGLARLLRNYLIVVLVLGVAALGYWSAKGAGLTGLQAMISVFVVSCPCALGLSIPLADDLAATAMERLGVYVRTAGVWQRLRRVRKVVFDKTGTLTLERPVLENPEAVAQLDEAAALALAQLTRGSLHPVARTLLEALGMRGQKLLAQHPGAVPEEFAGLGVALNSPAGRWSLGRAGWSGMDATGAAAATTAGSELRLDAHWVASFQFSEALRPGATAMLRRLERRGLALYILSGDHPAKVASMAQALGLPAAHAHGGLSPEEKSRRVSLVSRQDTLYLGDGANDALAFDAALVTGTPVVDRSLLESKADFYTLGAGLGFLPPLLQTAATRAIAVRSAFGFALVYNITTVSFAMNGRMSPLLAAILMPLSSIVSILLVATIFRAIAAKND
ncbi:MAG: HAD family hydrolase [Verrucomicrobia bacterium]|nr:MAG: HAD family hydrolase [Verrucomicrobiota bacterium]